MKAVALVVRKDLLVLRRAPVLLVTLRRKSFELPKAGPLMKTIRPFFPDSTAPAGAGSASSATASPSNRERRAMPRT